MSSAEQLEQDGVALAAASAANQSDQQLQAAAAAGEQQQQMLQQPVSYQLDIRGKIEGYDEADWFVPQEPPFKLRNNVAMALVGNKPHPWKRVKQMLAAENYAELPPDTPTWVNLEAPPSAYPARHYCDITGAPAPYSDPQTRLRYANADAFRIARSLMPDEVQARLTLRNAQKVLK